MVVGPRDRFERLGGWRLAYPGHVSAYPSWSFHLSLRDDIEPSVLRVLTAVARDVAPDPADLGALHPVPAHYLQDWRRMLTGELPPYVGPPVRLSGAVGQEHCLTIEFSQHDDEHANGGWVLWVWVLQLAARSKYLTDVGSHNFDRRDSTQSRPILLDASGADMGGQRLSWAELDEIWADLTSDRQWDGWRQG